ncbi:MAG TPA: dTDP-glucose 4,6-dehydratase [Terriglobia bacterium]|nr:dTDP-glucose 4,6-dehydratase [Terriglobia bacterium]
MKLMVTGGAGFIGSNFIRYVLAQHPQDSILNLDKLTYSGNLQTLRDLEKDERYTFVRGDIGDRRKVQEILSSGFEAIVHFAAETHVDRSILEGSAFVKTNVLGTQCLLDAARHAGIKRFVLVSTDEVYGSAPSGEKFTENSPLAPNSPYAASKAGADLLARAHFRTFRFPVIITRCTNNYGPYQYPEKFIPLMLTRAVKGQSIPVYGDGLQVRDWIWVMDHCAGLDAALRKGREGEVYNFGAGNEWPNLEIARRLLRLVGKPESLLTFVQDRPGHDRRYALDCEKANRELGWAPQTTLEEGLKQTVAWYSSNSDWVRHVAARGYRAYYRKHYDRREATLAEVLDRGGKN